MSKSKIGTIFGLILIAIGGALGGLGHSVPAAAVLITVGAALTATGQALFGASAILLLIFARLSMACTTAQGTAIAVATIDATVCVLNHSQEPIPQIVKDCDGVTAEDVIKILDAHKGAEMREKDAAAAGVR